MISKSDTNIADVISIFQNLNLDCCFIVPTETGMEKSILDATFPYFSVYESELYSHSTLYVDWDPQFTFSLNSFQ